MIVNVDAKSLEWCTYLFLSQDKVGIEEWHNVVTDPTKHDIHRSNQEAFRLPSRLIAKVFLFRWIYRGSAYAYSKDPDFVGVSRSQDFWQEVIDRYYAKYRGLHACHMQYIQTATTTGKLRSPFGREYTFEPRMNKRGDLVWSENDITNWPNQGCGADVMAIARVALFNRIKREQGLNEIKFISTVHDSIVLDVPEKHVEYVAQQCDKVFKDLPSLITKAYGVEWTLPMLGEVSVGPNMKHLTELKF